MGRPCATLRRGQAAVSPIRRLTHVCDDLDPSSFLTLAEAVRNVHPVRGVERLRHKRHAGNRPITPTRFGRAGCGHRQLSANFSNVVEWSPVPEIAQALVGARATSRRRIVSKVKSPSRQAP